MYPAAIHTTILLLSLFRLKMNNKMFQTTSGYQVFSVFGDLMATSYKLSVLCHCCLHETSKSVRPTEKSKAFFDVLVSVFSCE